MPQRLDFFFFIGSLYTHVAVMRIPREAMARGIEVRWRPFNLRAIMVEQNNIPARNAVKMAYTWRDIERRCAALWPAVQARRALPGRSRSPREPRGGCRGGRWLVP
jgi:2-hydroxychromene-2-carboxylate isomerase